jgi:hypothetical protein
MVTATNNDVNTIFRQLARNNTKKYTQTGKHNSFKEM